MATQTDTMVLGVKDFLYKNTDKLLVMIVMFLFYGGSWYGFRYLDPNFGNASLDLVKQLAAAFLTLTVSRSFATRTVDTSTNGGTDGKTSTTVTAIRSGPDAPSAGGV